MTRLVLQAISTLFAGALGVPCLKWWWGGLKQYLRWMASQLEDLIALREAQSDVAPVVPMPMEIMEHACLGNYARVMEWLDSSGCDVNLKCDGQFEHGLTLLMGVCMMHPDLWYEREREERIDEDGRLAILEALLERDADVDVQSSNGKYTALMLACMSRSGPMVHRLLAAGARTDLRDTGNLNALDHATQANQDELVAVLEPLSGPSLRDVRQACALGDVEPLRRWVAGGADIDGRVKQDLRTGQGHGLGDATLLWYCAARGQDAAVRALLELGAQPDAVCLPPPVSRDIFGGHTPLMQAVWQGHVTAARILVRAGAERARMSATGETALQIATNRGHVECARMLRACDHLDQWRIVCRVAGPLMLLWARARERANAPGAPGYEAARADFEVSREALDGGASASADVLVARCSRATLERLILASLRSKEAVTLTDVLVERARGCDPFEVKCPRSPEACS